jgi:NAD(P)H-flavin reductase
MKAERIEAFFYNHGMEIALGVLYLALNILAAAHGAYQFTEIGGFKTEDDILRVTLPIARAGGRLVTLNCAVLLLTGCKYLWTCIRTYVAPIIPIGFPIDNIMPKYHRYVALTIIVSGCIVHTLPQIVNYATKSITMDHDGMKFWTFGDGFASKQLLLTGSYLTVIFTTFFVTTLKSFRKTAAGFRWFWFFHMGGIATAYPLLLIHGTCRGHPIFLYFAIAPLLLYLFDIAMRRSNVSTTDIVEWITHDDEGQQITELIVKCPRNFAYTPGQYVELKYPPISKREWHPFTIASAPIEKDKISDQTNLVFYIKNSGRWTEALYNCATNAFDATKSTQNPMQIQIRGPHGGPAMNYFEYKHIVVIGSGVGVTPLLSIWKYLVARGRTMVYNPDKSAKGSVFTLFGEGSSLQENLDESHKSMKKFGADGRTRISTFRSTCIFLEKVFESMTVSMSLLILFVLGETLAFVLQIFGFSFAANSFGSALSLIALIAHGSAVLVSTVALGWSNYFKQFKCWLESAIIIVDTFALWFSLKSCMVAHADLVGVESMTAISAYFIFFGLVVILHTILIFHIFYKALKPTSHADNTNVTKSVSKLLSNSVCTKSSYSSFTNQEICSIDGILINRMYSNMKFAARVLLPPIIEEGMADLFSMEFYGTREESKDRDRSENGLIADMMGSFGRGLDIRSHMCKHQHDEYFHPGRPNWTKIFLKAMAKAHQRNPKGESVGVFFCGSPAIAKDLQVAAAEVTARHQFAVKHMDGEACKCKLIVHSENF